MIKVIHLFCLALLLPLSMSAQREFWGTVENGGENGSGYLYRTDSTGDNMVIVFHFNAPTGRAPGTLFWDNDGKLYGLANRGGTGDVAPNKGGTLYEYNLETDSFRVLVHFDVTNTQFPYDAPDGYNGLVMGAPGVLYGQAIAGGLQIGRIFSYDIALGNFMLATSVPTFQGGSLNTTQGNRLLGPLFKASDGFLYGTTVANSQCPIPQPGRGSIIRINPSGNSFATLYLNPCSASDGYQYGSSFIEENASLYSVSKLGGTGDFGVIYKYTPSTNTYEKKYDFQGGALGKNPSVMTRATNGKYYGTAIGGVPQPNLPGGGGIIYEFDPVGGFSKKLDFIYETTGTDGVGINPIGSPLVNARNGKLYGKTKNGIFEYDPSSNNIRPAARWPSGTGWPSTNNPSLIEICRKPTYRHQASTYVFCGEGSVIHNLHCQNATSVVWKHNGIADPSQTDMELVLDPVSGADTGTWTAELTNACGTTVTQAIQVYLDISAPAITLNGQALETGSAESYQWVDCEDNEPISGETGQQFTPSQNGNYAVIVTNSAGCSDTSACYTVAFVGLGLETAFLPNISLYPNPAKDMVYISTGNIPIRSAVITNMLGQPVMYVGSVQHVDVSPLASGTYFMAIQTEKGEHRVKFVKR